jgi:hypothetical protein
LREQPQLLALPTGAQRARRFLRALCRQAPTEARDLIVVTGDGIAFNNVYRDRDVAWNIGDMPVPLVFFSHRDPIDLAAGFGATNTAGLASNTGTSDVLLDRDIVETLVQAAFDGKRLVGDADILLERLRQIRWYKGHVINHTDASTATASEPFFDAAGNRRPDTGEHIVSLRPVLQGNRNLPEAFLTVWRQSGTRPERTWRAFSPPLHLFYDRPSSEEGAGHGS